MVLLKRRVHLAGRARQLQLLDHSVIKKCTIQSTIQSAKSSCPICSPCSKTASELWAISLLDKFSVVAAQNQRGTPQTFENCPYLNGSQSPQRSSKKSDETPAHLPISLSHDSRSCAFFRKRSARRSRRCCLQLAKLIMFII